LAGEEPLDGRTDGWHWSTYESIMAVAMTMQPPSIRHPPIPSSSSPNPSQRFNVGLGSAVSQKYTSAEAVGQDGRSRQCDGCKRRNNRCAMNIATNKCYSCDFHRQDCTFTPSASRKRSFPNPFDIAGKKRYVRLSSIPSTQIDPHQLPCFKQVAVILI
jgi:hypothetical protein